MRRPRPVAQPPTPRLPPPPALARLITRDVSVNTDPAIYWHRPSLCHRPAGGSLEGGVGGARVPVEANAPVRYMGRRPLVSELLVCFVKPTLFRLRPRLESAARPMKR
ncbi:hypothetical protein EVAR_103064_1 [Eumeta japonica]|uniref:Uncharacterized protein n=1 Tax=Eumeta variegata TaxID=151549 RepID=A0A4C1WQL6_EUMVA|nr:hypothetical protein EVAR_103064_1 [Eumeta japonica]